MRVEAPHRAVRSYTQRLDAPPEAVFPLLCPVRECDYTEYRPPERIGFVKVTPGETVARISIELAPEGEARTGASVTYGYTALSETGREVVDGFTEEHYTEFMKEWEGALNGFLGREGKGSGGWRDRCCPGTDRTTTLRVPRVGVADFMLKQLGDPGYLRLRPGLGY